MTGKIGEGKGSAGRRWLERKERGREVLEEGGWKDRRGEGKCWKKVAGKIGEGKGSARRR